MTVHAILDVLARHRFRVDDEAALQDALALAFHGAGIVYTREAILGDAGRIDFLAAGRIGIEVKVDGSCASVLQQLTRYAESGEVSALMLVTTRAQHIRLRRMRLAVPLSVVHLSLPGFLA